MSLTKEVKDKIIKQFAKSTKDTGSSEIQIAFLSERIRQVSEHLKKFPKDKHSRTGLLNMVGKRKSFQRYLKNKNVGEYEKFMVHLRENGYM